MVKVDFIHFINFDATTSGSLLRLNKRRYFFSTFALWPCGIEGGEPGFLSQWQRFNFLFCYKLARWLWALFFPLLVSAFSGVKWGTNPSWPPLIVEDQKKWWNWKCTLNYEVLYAWRCLLLTEPGACQTIGSFSRLVYAWWTLPATCLLFEVCRGGIGKEIKSYSFHVNNSSPT